MVYSILYSEEEVKHLLESLSDNLIIIKRDTTILDYTGKEASYLVKPTFYLNKKLTDCIPKTLKVPLLNGIEKVLNTKNDFTFNYEYPKDKYLLEVRLIAFSDELIAVALRNITSIKQKLKELKQIKKDIRTEGDKLLISSFILQDDKLKYVNTYFEKISGYTHEEIKAWKPNEYLKLIHPEYRDFVKEQANIKQIDLDEVIPSYIVKGIKKDGTEIWIEISSESFTYEGSPSIIGTMREISKFKKIKDPRKSEISTLYGLIPMGSFIISKKYNIINFNLKSLEFLNIRKNIYGERIFDIFPKELNNILKICIDNTLKTQKLSRMDTIIKINNKGNYLCVKTLNFDKKRVIVFLRDRTEEFNKLFSSRLNDLTLEDLNSISEVGLLVLQDNKFVFMNEILINVLGFTDKLILNWNLDNYVEMIEPKYKKVFLTWIDNRKKNNPETLPHLTYNILTRNKLLKRVIHFSNSFFYKEGFSDLIVFLKENGEFQDIIWGKEKDDLSHNLSEFKNELINRISHELRTPLTSIYTASEILLKYYREGLDKNILEFVEVINRGGKRLKNLIETFIEVSLYDLDMIKIEQNPVEINKIVSACIDNYDSLIKKRELCVENHIPEHIILNLDESKVRLVLSNIILNSINNTERLGRIIIKSIENDENIIIIIEDTGIGLTDNELSRIFKKFGKIERYGQGFDVEIDGPGLGLYLSKKIIELHGGHINAESEGRNKGTKLMITFNR